VGLVSAGGAIALIAHALALVAGRAPADPLGAVALGAALVVLLAVVHFAGRVRGAALGPGVLAAQVRHWLSVAGAGALAGLGLTLGAVLLAPTRLGATLPVVAVAGVLGVLLAVAGVVSLVTHDSPPPRRRE
jgi:hypothetical protein